MIDIDIGYSSQAGTKPLNEDFVAAMLPEKREQDMGAIMAVADGVSMGGMGREAAQTTVTSLVRDYFGTPPTWDTSVALDRIIAAQNSWLAGLNRRRHPALGLTTLTALVLRGQSYTLAHVGDSRCYLLRGGLLTQLSHDHIVNHPDFKHQLLRSVGAEDHLVVDYAQGEVMVGDVFILLSDGVHGSLSDARMQGLIEQTTRADKADKSETAANSPDAVLPTPCQTISQRLVDAALKAGSRDNVTALVASVKSLSAATLEDDNRAALSLAIPPHLKVGDHIDGLTVTAIVADSGINILYQVREPVSKKLYALKTLNPARAHDKEERAMLAHEAWLAKHLQASRASDYLVTLHESTTDSAARLGQPTSFYLLYDWHSGETLQQLLDQQQRLGPVQAVSAAMQTLRVLGLLHRQGVIHRDIKPANLHQGDDGVLRVLDLGVALSGREPESMRRLHAGTPSFVNPEQWGHHSKAGGGSATEGEPELPDAQSDLFALGVTLYQLLTGKLPYGEVLPYQLGRYYRDPTAPSRHNPEVPIWLDHVLLKAVARDKSQRFETAEEFLLALERGASRPLTVPPASALLQRDPTMLWKLLLGFSALFNLLLVYWLLFLPK